LKEVNLLEKIVIGDETWIFQHDPETRPRKKVRMSKSKVTGMLICFCDFKGIICYKLYPPKPTLN
jgi:hypothetical protein